MSTPQKSMIAEPDTPPKLPSKTRRLWGVVSDPKTPDKSDSASVMATQGSPSPSLPETLILGQTPPTTPRPKRSAALAASGSKDGIPDKNVEGKGDESKQPKEGVVPKSGESKSPKASGAQGGDWKKRWNPDLVPMMMADTESEEDAPENIRLLARVAKLREEYRDLQNYHHSFGEGCEPWKSFKEGNLRDGGWIKSASGTWHKPGSVPAVVLPKKVQREIDSPQKGGIVMSMKDLRYLDSNKKSQPQRGHMSSSSKSKSATLKKPAATKDLVKGQSSLKTHFAKKKPAASSGKK